MESHRKTFAGRVECVNLASFTKSSALFEHAIEYRDSVALVWPGHARAIFSLSLGSFPHGGDGWAQSTEYLPD